MSLLINNDLIWISVPKCASVSIETALIDSEIDIRLLPDHRYNYEKKTYIRIYEKISYLMSLVFIQRYVSLGIGLISG